MQADIAKVADIDRLFVLVEVLAKEIGIRGVTVNSILPTAIEGAGVYTSGASEEVMQFVP